MYGYMFRPIMWSSSSNSDKINSKSQFQTSFRVILRSVLLLQNAYALNNSSKLNS